MVKQIFKVVALVPVAGIMLASCANVKAYQKSRLNDSEMILGNRKVEKNELNFQSYREGASGANGGKTGGGCGCN
ncbi:MAG: DUF4266 domain-containing protein [Bacteroidota bacterium]|nr:DUF4266 domain-containing protein [Bacteroidota bacterium]